jgi:hypothetical protein
MKVFIEPATPAAVAIVELDQPLAVSRFRSKCSSVPVANAELEMAV